MQGNRYYSIDNNVPDEVSQEVKDAIKAIVGGLREGFRHLACAGFAQREDLGVSTAWSLTPLGQEKLRVSRSLVSQRLALKPRSGIEVEERTTFVLVCWLQRHGWLCTVKEKGQGHSRKNKYKKSKGQDEFLKDEGDPLPSIPYVHGGERRWWMHDSAVSI